MKIWCGLEELIWSSEFYGHIVVSWTWCVGRSPLLSCKPGLSVENPSSFRCVSRQGKPITISSSILTFISSWTRRLLYDRKSFPIWFNSSILRVSIFADTMFPCIVLEIIRLVCTWTRSIIPHIILLDDINCFAMKWILLRHSSFYLILILNRKICTFPTPGCLWIWGTKYDLSGDFSLAVPKDDPLVYWKHELMR